MKVYYISVLQQCLYAPQGGIYLGGYSNFFEDIQISSRMKDVNKETQLHMIVNIMHIWKEYNILHYQ